MFDFNNTQNHLFTIDHLKEIFNKLDIPFISINDIKNYQWTFIPHMKEDMINQHDRFELIGSAFINYSVMKYLLSTYPQNKALYIQTLHQNILTQSHLSIISNQLRLLDHLCLDIHNERLNERQNTKLHVRLLRAFIGAIHVDSGEKNAELFLNALLRKFPLKTETMCARDILTKYFQKEYKCTPEFINKIEGGSDHAPIYSSTVYNIPKTIILGKGIGKTKKEANNASAQQALNYLNR